jgi:hypothetical protein
MAGTDDPLVPFANGRILASLIPDARLVTLDDGHLFLVTNARESAAMISEFLSWQGPVRARDPFPELLSDSPENMSADQFES